MVVVVFLLVALVLCVGGVFLCGGDGVGGACVCVVLVVVLGGGGGGVGVGGGGGVGGVGDVNSKTQWRKPNVKFHSQIKRGDHMNVEYTKP
eukprot:891528-Pyramimonas_sp.AAC.1